MNKSYKDMSHGELLQEILRVRAVLKGDDGKRHNPKHLRDYGKYYQKLCKERNEFLRNKYENGTN